MKNRFLSIFGSMLLTALFCGGANAETFYAYLSAAQEVPTNASTATGYARVFVNESTMTLNFTIVFNGLSSNQIACHIHAPAAIGANVGVAIDFGAVGGTSGTITGSRAITTTQLSQLRSNLGYVNVHSGNFSGGEIRGQLGKRRPVDFDGDGRQDFSVLRFPNIAPPGVAPMSWWNDNSTVGSQNVDGSFTDANRDFPTPGDWDGDGKDDYAVFRGGATAGAQSEYWILKSSDSTLQYYAWGVNGDLNAARDYDGDGITDPAVFRRGAVGSTARWYIRQSTDGVARLALFGTSGIGANNQDFPIPGDYDGDGKFDIAVYRAGTLSPSNTWIVLRSSDNQVSFTPFGNFTSDYILPGDYDGDGKYDFAVARTGAVPTSPLVWWIRQTSTSTIRVVVWGQTSDLPAQGDYDGDTRADIAVYRAGATSTSPSTYWVVRSFDNTNQVKQWGLGSDFSVNTFDIR